MPAKSPTACVASLRLLRLRKAALTRRPCLSLSVCRSGCCSEALKKLSRYCCQECGAKELFLYCWVRLCDAMHMNHGCRSPIAARFYVATDLASCAPLRRRVITNDAERMPTCPRYQGKRDMTCGAKGARREGLIRCGGGSPSTRTRASSAKSSRRCRPPCTRRSCASTTTSCSWCVGDRYRPAVVLSLALTSVDSCRASCTEGETAMPRVLGAAGRFAARQRRLRGVKDGGRAGYK
jgi:hypothetical protein